MTINSQIELGEELRHFSPDEIKREPMLYRADFIFAWENGGPITREFLARLPNEWTDSPLVIDSRVHMLMPGMFPCIPGWHHDDVPREREDGQPNYENPSYHAEHAMAIFGDCSRTEFALGQSEFAIPPVGHKIYKELDPIVSAKIHFNQLRSFRAPEAQIVFFNWQTWHRGTETTKTGFRFFIRASRSTALPVANEMRLNANVYMPVLEEGW